MKYSVLKFFIFVGIVGIIAGTIGAKVCEDDRAMAEAAAKATAYDDFSFSIRAYADADEEELYRNLCIVGVVTSLILTSACIVAHVAGKSADEKKAKAATNIATSTVPKQPSVKEKLTELENLKNSKLISEKEYSEMRKEILASIKKG